MQTDTPMCKHTTTMMDHALDTFSLVDLVCITMAGGMPTRCVLGRFNICRVKWRNSKEKTSPTWSYVTRNRGWSISTVRTRSLQPLCERFSFVAPWCGHCHQFSPIFEIIARVSAARIGKRHHLRMDVCRGWMARRIWARSTAIIIEMFVNEHRSVPIRQSNFIVARSMLNVRWVRHSSRLTESDGDLF